MGRGQWAAMPSDRARPKHRLSSQELRRSCGCPWPSCPEPGAMTMKGRASLCSPAARTSRCPPRGGGQPLFATTSHDGRCWGRPRGPTIKERACSRPSVPTKGHSRAAGQRLRDPCLSPHPRREPRSPERSIITPGPPMGKGRRSSRWGKGGPCEAGGGAGP